MTAQTLSLLDAAARVDSAKALFVDWDGCLAAGNDLLPGARRFLATYGGKVHIMSNNSTRLPQDLCAFLDRRGIHIPVNRIFLAGHCAITQARTRYSRVFLLGNQQMHAFAHGIGLTLTAETPDAVILLRDTTLTYDKLTTAVNLVAAGVPLLVANPDRTHPGQNSVLTPETGALLAAITACLPKGTPKPEVIGKPHGLLFDLALAKCRARPDEVVMIGDSPDTDIEGARTAGLQSILVDRNSEVSINSITEMAAPLVGGQALA